MTDQFAGLGGDQDIAIVGMAGRFPGARNLDDFWSLIERGDSAFTRRTPEELLAAGVSPDLVAHPDYVPVVGMLEDVDAFDASFFEIGPRDAALMDPQHRHFLECCWEALEDAGHPPSQFPGSVGVYAGSGMNGYLIHNLLSNPELTDSLGMFMVRHTSNDKDFLATGVSYRLNLRGPSVNVQTACSTSLVAVHLAVQALLGRECDMALAGGVTIEVPHGAGYLYRDGEVLSRDGVCRAFDAQSSGTVLTSGAGAVVLRRLADAVADGDHVYAVIKATAINNDGSGKIGYLAPSVDGHASVVVEAQDVAGIDPETVQYVEAHGTGTPVGDPIEITALTQAFQRTTGATGFARIGSVKPSVGHLDTAAGVASVIKTSLALTNRVLPPMAGYTAPNPLLELDATPFVLSPEAAEWPRLATPRRAGVSSLGVGGTNAHAVIEEAPARGESEAFGSDRQVLPLSAKSADALDRMRLRLADHLEQHPEMPLRDVAFTLQDGRDAFGVRDAIVASSHAEASGRLRETRAATTAHPDPSVVFMFPGGGAQYPNMGRCLYETEPVYRDAVDRCLQLLEPGLRCAVSELLFPPPGREESAAEQLAMPSVQLPAIFLTEYALAQLWLSWGVRPAAMTGHSLGEYTAACLAGVFSLEDALSIVALRGCLMERVPDAAMLSVALPEPRVRELINADISVAAVNAPELCVVSGTSRSIESFEARLHADDVSSRRIRIIGAVHCGLLDPFLEEFSRRLETVKLSPPSIPYISNVTGDWVRAEDATNPQYWVRHLRYTVRFADGLATLLADPNQVLVEIGPGNTLSSLARQQPVKPVAALPSLPHPMEKANDADVAFAALGRAWAAGAPVDWSRLHGGLRRNRVSLPPYPFERQRHWIDPAPAKDQQSLRLLEAGERLFRPAWTREDLVNPPAVTAGECWLLVGEGTLGAELERRLASRGARVARVEAGAAFGLIQGQRFRLPMDNRAAWKSLFEHLRNERMQPAAIVFLAETDTRNKSPRSLFPELLAMLQAMGDTEAAKGVRLAAVTRGAKSVDGDLTTDPLGALADGPIRVAAHEFEDLTTALIDLEGGRRRSRRGAADEVDDIINEIVAGLPATAVAIRGGRRWTHGVEQLRVGSAPLPAAIIPGGRFLITGGTSGIGLALAGHLAESARARVVLMGRRTLPGRPGWDAVLRDQPDSELGETIATLRAIEAAGGQVLVATGDVTTGADVERVVAEAVREFGGLDGCFHAAGVLDDGLIQSRDAEACQRVLAPKVAGTAHLYEALKRARVPFLVLFSSISAQLGLEGQVDYTAANAFLDAFALSKPDGTIPQVLAVDWGRWDEVGMASGVARGDGLPFLGRAERRSSSLTFSSRKTPDSCWVLDDHRLADGTAVLPGTAYLQAFASAARSAAATSSVGLRQVEWLAPLRATGAEPVTFTVAVEADEVALRSGGVLHGRANLAPATARPVAAPEVPAALRDRPVAFGKSAGRRMPQEANLRFGPRWDVLDGLRLGNGEALAELSLPEPFTGDLVEFDLHPGMLDIALSAGLPLVDPAGERLWAPSRLESFTVYGTLERQVTSFARLRPQENPDEAVFDCTVRSPSGEVLACAEGMTFRAVSSWSGTPNGKSRPALIPLGFGIKPAEGFAELERVLALPSLRNVIVSSVDPKALEARANRPSTGTAVVVARPALASTFAEPRDELERALVAVWAEFLGVDTVGVDDDFFDLGGHSLIAVRILTRVQNRYGLQLPLATFFDAPTVARLASVIRAEKGVSESTAPGEVPATSARWASLVPIRGGSENAPFFCVHGMYGNVVIFRDLAAAMQPGRPFYGLQQRGLNGTDAPHETFEDMAADYISEIREVQPAGPYYLGGYSGGGLVAFEMAKQLRAAGEEVAALVMLDTPGPFVISHSPSARMQRFLRRVRRNGAGYVSRRVRRFANQRRWQRDFRGATGFTVGEENFNFELGNAMVAAQRKYQFLPGDVPITLITATVRSEDDAFLPPHMGWHGYAPRVVVREVEASHMSMCVGSNAVKVAAEIDRALA